ncbi:hypothetical protein [Candidatus Mycoplasma haematohominis]|uniref:hypothetical protein n=1 Tax=Candidatus Mycoplasma haematohominis TaxID=1494318 RepID=UPI001C0A7321|nr:hypothetical protein [Candidatus Mycoplasma haemohominis]
MKFADVQSAYEDDSEPAKEKALNQICKAAFTSQKTDVLIDTAADDANKFKESEVWKYCSASRTGSKPVLLKDSQDQEDLKLITAAGSTETWGKKSKDHLVSTKNTSNDWFWELKEKKFSSEKDSETVGEQNIFKTRKRNGNSVKQACQLAYVKDSTNSTAQVEEADLKKYCYFEKVT